MNIIRFLTPIGVLIAGVFVGIFVVALVGLLMVIFSMIILYSEFSAPRSTPHLLALYVMMIGGILLLTGDLWFAPVLDNAMARVNYSLIIIFLFALSIALVYYRNLQTLGKWFLIVFGGALVVMILVSALCAGLDALGLNTGAGSAPVPILWGLEGIASVAVEIGLVVKIVTSLLPACVAVIGIFSWYTADDADEHQTALFEVVGAGAILFIFVWAFGFLGITIV